MDFYPARSVTDYDSFPMDNDLGNLDAGVRLDASDLLSEQKYDQTELLPG